MFIFLKNNWIFLKNNWKMGIHLLFRTKRFGVNNRWYSDFDSIFGYSNWKIFVCIIKVKPIFENYEMMKFRSAACHFSTEKTNKKLGWYKYWDR